MDEQYTVTVKIFLDGNQWGALVGEYYSRRGRLRVFGE